MRKVVKKNPWDKGKIEYYCDRCHNMITGTRHKSGKYDLCAECRGIVNRQEAAQETRFIFNNYKEGK